MTVGSTRRRLTPPRRIAGTASTGMARTTAKTSRLAAVRPGDRAVGGQPGLDEHPVLQRGAERAAAGRDLRQRVARQLRADDGGPRRPAHGQVLERPQARERERLQAGHRGQPPRGQLVEVVPRAEDVDQARRDEVERDAGDGEPEHAAAQPSGRGGLGGLPALDLVLDVRALVDRALDAVADLAHRRSASVRTAGVSEDHPGGVTARHPRRGDSRAVFPSLRGYRQEWLRGDVIAGLTVWAVLVPESLAYASIAGVSPVVGLYAAPPALLLYALLGSSRHLSSGRCRPPRRCRRRRSRTSPPRARPEYVTLTAALAITTGIAALAAGLLRLGFLASFISEPVLKGFIVGLALTIIAGQLPKLFGVEKGDGELLRADLGPARRARRHERGDAGDRPRLARGGARPAPVRAGRPGVAGGGGARGRAGRAASSPTASTSSARSTAGCRRSASPTRPPRTTSTWRRARSASRSSASPRASARPRPTRRATTTRSTRTAS